MLTIEEYILQMKKKDNLDEFNFKNHAENMTTIIKYVMEYFNTYLNPEDYDYENIKAQQTALKIEKEIEDKLPKSKDFIIEYYKKYKTRIDRVLKGWFRDTEYIDLFFCMEDYEKVVSKFCGSSKIKNTGIEQYKNEFVILLQEIKENQVDKPSIAGFKYLDNSLVSWIKETYREYGVNLLQFAQGLTFSYYEEYVEYKYDRDAEQSYHINRYNHRYNNNPFGIDEIYKENSHRPFINGRKGELEMLLMYEWLFNNIKDTEYWSEYVNLCVSTKRVSIVNNVNILLPAIHKGISYPEDIKTTIAFVETTNGSLKNNPGGSYIIRLGYSNENDMVWKDEKELSTIIGRLNDTFKNYGVPHTLELLSPLRSQTYNEEEFFAQYRLLEKSMKKYTNMKIALVNGPHRHKTKPIYLMQFVEDIVKIRNIAKEMKLKLKIAVDISKLVTRKKYRNDFENDFNRLSEIRNSIVGIHLTYNSNNSNFSGMIYTDEKIYLNKFEYPQIPDFLGCISALLNDNQCRYFVPEEINNTNSLEELIDDLLRAGFSFPSQEGE